MSTFLIFLPIAASEVLPYEQMPKIEKSFERQIRADMLPDPERKERYRRQHPA
jgi:hypothetical protein